MRTRSGKTLKDLSLEELDKNLMEEVDAMARPNVDLLNLIREHIRREAPRRPSKTRGASPKQPTIEVEDSKS